MTLNAKYDPDNIFAKIIRGDIPSVKLYETDDVLAFMDVFPQSEGHCLVVHKRATAINLFDIGADDLSTLMAGVQKVAAAAKTGLSPDGLRVIQYNGAPAGQTIYHLHFHIVPIYEGRALGRHGEGGPTPADALEKTAARIRAHL